MLREAGLVRVRREAQRRVYSLRPEALAEVDEWLGRYRARWQQRLDALNTRGGPESANEGAPDDQQRTWERPHPGQPAIGRWQGRRAHAGPLRHQHRRPVIGAHRSRRLARWIGDVEGNLRLSGEFRFRFFASGSEGIGRVEECEPS